MRVARWSSLDVRSSAASMKRIASDSSDATHPTRPAWTARQYIGGASASASATDRPVAVACSRTLGDLDFKQPAQLLTADPEVRRVRLDRLRGDCLVLIASDGLFDVLDDATAAAIALRELQLVRVAAAGAGSFAPIGLLSHGLQGNSSHRLTYYDSTSGPLVTSISPAYGHVEADPQPAYTLHGSNFAPTGELRCRFGFGSAGDTTAEYISPTQIACARPSFEAPMDVPVVASIDGGDTFSVTAAVRPRESNLLEPSLEPSLELLTRVGPPIASRAAAMYSRVVAVPAPSC